MTMTQPQKYLISDLHLGHSKIVHEFEDKRPFASIEEHDATIMENMLVVLKNGDHLYVLGDVVVGVSYKEAMNILGPLMPYKAQLHLALGNHDSPGRVKDIFPHFFGYISDAFELDDYVLTHIPVRPGQLSRWKGNIHGHVHSHSLDDPRYFNASAENIGYAPILFSAVKMVLRNGV